MYANPDRVFEILNQKDNVSRRNEAEDGNQNFFLFISALYFSKHSFIQS